FNLTVNGTTSVLSGGTLLFNASAGVKQFTGLVTVAGNWTNTAANSPVNIRGGITNSGTFNSGSGIYTFNTNPQTLSGTLAIANVTVTGVILTNTNSLTVSTALSGTGNLTQAVNAILNLGGTAGITTLTASNAGNTVNYTGGVQIVH